MGLRSSTKHLCNQIFLDPSRGYVVKPHIEHASTSIKSHFSLKNHLEELYPPKTNIEKYLDTNEEMGPQTMKIYLGFISISMGGN